MMPKIPALKAMFILFPSMKKGKLWNIYDEQNESHWEIVVWTMVR